MRDFILTGKKYGLASIEYPDLEKIRIWRNKQMENLRQFRPLTIKNQEKFWDSIANDEKTVLFAIIAKENENLIGYCGVVNIHPVYSHGELSFLVDDQIDQKGPVYREIHLECLHLLCDYAFNQLHLNRIFTETYEFRKEHIVNMERFGMVKEGILREHVFKNGTFCNSIIHSILKKEYQMRE